MKKVVFGLAVIATLLLVGCASAPSDPIYADVIGFSDDVSYRYKYFYIGSSGSNEIENARSHIKKLPTGRNTAMYYALDVGLDRIEEIQEDRKDDENTKYYVVLLTDGLDNVSVEMARNNKRGDYMNLSEYGEVLQKRMASIFNEKKFLGLVEKENLKNSFQSYAILVKGEDLKKSDYTDEELRQLLVPITGAQNEYRPAPIVDDSYDKVLEEFKKKFVVTSFSFRIPKGYAGQRIQMKLFANDGTEYFVEGDFVRNQVDKFMGKTEYYYTFENMTSNGLSFDGFTGTLSGEESEYDPNNVLFAFNKMLTGDNPVKVDDSEQRFLENEKWRFNSEYQHGSATKKNAYVLFILDRSSSMGADRSKAEDAAIKMIEFISDNI